MPVEVVAVVALVIVAVAGVLKGSIGFGAPLLAVPALAMLVGTRSAVVLIALPLFTANVALLLGRPADPAALRRFVPLMATLVPATFLGGALLANLDVAVLSVVVGFVTLAFVALTLAGVQLATPPRAETAVSPLVGVAGGLLQGATSIPGSLFAIYLTGLRLDKRAFVYGITLIFVAGNVAQVATYLRFGLYTRDLLLGSLGLAVVLLLGQQIGFKVQDRLDPDRFRWVVLVAVAASGTLLLVRGLGWL